MKTRVIMGTALAALALVSLTVAIRQHRILSELRAEGKELRQEPGLLFATAAVALGVAPAAPSPEPLSPQEKIELMQLRSRVTDLKQRRRALTDVTNENVTLQRQLQTMSQLAAGRLPPGYIRRSEAKFLGATTPEATLESFLWAIENRDTNVLFGLFLPHVADSMVRDVERQGSQQFFEKTLAVAGFRIVGRQDEGTDKVEVKIEFMPGQEPPATATLLKEGDGWRILDF